MEEPGKGAGVFVTHGPGDFRQAPVGLFQQFLGLFHAQLLEVAQGGIAGGIAEAALEGARGHMEVLGQLVNADGLGEVFRKPVLYRADGLVLVVAPRVDAAIGGLAFPAHVHHEGPGQGTGRIHAAVALHEEEAEVQPCHAAAGAEDVVIRGDQPVGAQAHFRVAFTEQATVAPVSGGLATVQQAGLPQKEGAGAVAGQVAAFVVPPLEEGKQRPVGIQGPVNVAADGGNDHQIGLWCRVPAAAGHQADAIDAVAGATVSGREGNAEPWFRLLIVDTGPGYARHPEQIHDAGNGGGQGFLKADDGDLVVLGLGHSGIHGWQDPPILCH
mgnify:FL=1